VASWQVTVPQQVVELLLEIWIMMMYHANVAEVNTDWEEVTQPASERFTG